ncbi:MAG: low molecular weight phosphatase family protein [Candidatus Viridilinea halotolerans]|uniref:protein-tyrosine-phosphatase n=1 Tax=Candidatus Viridilinea halotolerans TaxID=2491704 RepID=A0A426U5Z1_9CHLR|nr:MAG: low molecular weight phosphatase family protein [Candidatus Viridilinea halotolerans]
MQHHHILIVGAADTGRAPMTVALLQRHLAQRGLSYPVASAGILGHDDAPAETEARAALLVLGLDLSAHCARSLTEELVAQAELLIAIDSGVARVVRARFPGALVYSLGELAERARDIPDPFRMQVGAWLQYANEIDAMLKAGMPRMLGLLGVADMVSERHSADFSRLPAPPTEVGTTEGVGGQVASDFSRLPAPPTEVGTAEGVDEQVVSASSPASFTQALALLNLAATLPAALNWPLVYEQLMATLDELETLLPATALSRLYVATLRVMLQRSPNPPTPHQAQQLHAGFQRLGGPIGPAELAALSQALV